MTSGGRDTLCDLSMIRRLLFPTTAMVVAAVLTFGGLHVLEFFFSPYEDTPVEAWIDGEVYTRGHLVKNNRYGFRQRDFTTPKPAGVYRVMVLGDSFTWGLGLAADDRYSAVAEELLNPGASDTTSTATRGGRCERVSPDAPLAGRERCCKWPVFHVGFGMSPFASTWWMSTRPQTSIVCTANSCNARSGKWSQHTDDERRQRQGALAADNRDAGAATHIRPGDSRDTAEGLPGCER